MGDAIYPARVEPTTTLQAGFGASTSEVTVSENIQRTQRILVVDDDVALSEMLQLVLKADGFDASWCSSGDGAVEASDELLFVVDPDFEAELAHYLSPRDRAALVREGTGEHRGIGRIRRKARRQLALPPGHAHLHRRLAEHRRNHLAGQRRDGALELLAGEEDGTLRLFTRRGGDFEAAGVAHPEARLAGCTPYGVVFANVDGQPGDEIFVSFAGDDGACSSEGGIELFRSR